MSTPPSDPPVPPVPPELQPSHERLEELAYAYLALWRLAYLKGSITLSVQGKGPDLDVVRWGRWQDDEGIEGLYPHPEFIAKLREAAGE